MAFKAALNFLKEYRIRRGKALENKERQAWSTVDLDSVSELVEKFESTGENSEWESLYNQDKADILKLQGAALKIDFLAGHRRDVRMMFACGPDNRVRTPLDQDRFERMKLNFYRQKLELLNQIITAQESGLKKI